MALGGAYRLERAIMHAKQRAFPPALGATGRAVQQDALRRLDAKAKESFGVLETKHKAEEKGDQAMAGSVRAPAVLKGHKFPLQAY
jgi:hypothetical protein